ncbi:uncharacterized protein LOC143468464 [Clavelina lepadiformis]|uniref:uncharacterized protein LOC143468464 n=1 Tax=Clavelina lepadiformis TaxID=159417 RepID=UPI00404143F1
MLVVRLVFLLAIAILQTQCNRENEKFLIYRYLSSRSGLCLSVARQIQNKKAVYIPVLTTDCNLNNTAWRWLKLKGGLLKNLKHDRCLAAAERGDGIGKLQLQPCDSDSHYQQWKCDSFCNLALDKPIHGSYYLLEHSLDVSSGREVTGGKPVMRLAGSTLSEKRWNSKWIIHDVISDDSIRCICDAGSSSVTSKPYIVTTSGGEVVGEACVFPFIFRGEEFWNCVKLDGKDICATVRNLDQHRNKFGVCPGHKRGTWSKWLGEPMCDKTCGMGNVYRKRKCLFPPCQGETVVREGDRVCNVDKCVGEKTLTIGGHSDQFPAFGVMQYLHEQTVGVCKFPYIADGRKRQSCISDKRRQQRWCSLTHNFDVHQKWGYCSNQTRAVWSSWSPVGGDHRSCSRSCGGGRLTLERTCPNYPTLCIGPKEKVGESCNTEPCPICYTGNGQGYRGRKNVANDGSVCQHWNDQSTHVHIGLHASDYSELELNYCRNPGGKLQRPYCYRATADLPSRMYCDIPKCGTDLSRSIISYTIPTDVDDSDNSDLPCMLPYFYKTEWLDTCMLLDESQPGREKCGVSLHKQRYCPSHYRGKWSEWKYAGECNHVCNGGFQVWFRRCYLAPCQGRAVKIDRSKPCNSFPCTWKQPGLSECYSGSGILYSGNVSTTIQGRTCLNWSDQSRQTITFRNNRLPDGMTRLAGNHCRNPNPDVYNAPWCYIDSVTTDGESFRWEYCDVPRCPTKEAEIFGLRNQIGTNQIKRPCVFPFRAADDKWHTTCALFDPQNKPTSNSKRYCANESKSIYDGTFKDKLKYGLLEATYLICPTLTRGTWSPWSSSGHCSAACGGGRIVLRRRCLHLPCSGSASNEHDRSEACNTQPCRECLIGNGADYRGDVNSAYEGSKCLRWSQFNADQTRFITANYPELTESFCRNPGGLSPLPWCFTSTDLRRSYCDITYCAVDHLTTIPFTVPLPGFNDTAAPCHFPYRYKDMWFSSCFKLTTHSPYFCPVVKEPQNDDNMTIGLCPLSFRGRWTAWKKTKSCSKMCGGGKVVYVRECLFRDCVGSKFKTEGSCNIHPCNFKKVLRENIDCSIGEGINYVGTTLITKCKGWRLMPRQGHSHYSGKSGIDLTSKLCRNPSPLGTRRGPWCYIDVERGTWEYCDIPRCPSHEGEVRTIAGPVIDRACHFPFKLNGVWRETCTPYGSGGSTFCSTVAGIEQNPENPDDKHWGQCPSVRPDWPENDRFVTSWALYPGPTRCSKQCGGGQLRYYRRCRVGDCNVEPREKNVGSCNTQPCKECIEGDGINYNGTKNWFEGTETSCRDWSTLSVLDGRNYLRLDVLGDRKHSYCRNISPDHYASPVCFAISSGRTILEACDIPNCIRGLDRVAIIGPVKSNRGLCHFPFKVKGKLKYGCQPFPAGHGAYCGHEVGEHDVLSESKFGRCSTHAVGIWSGWEKAKCPQPCGAPEQVYIRHCRYQPCFGPSTKVEGHCATQKCDKTRTCYDVRTKGVEYKAPPPGNTPYQCFRFPIPQAVTLCQNSVDSGQPRPFCPVLRNESEGGLLNMQCPIFPCPDSIVGPVMALTHNNLQEEKVLRPRELPCVFPFVSKGVSYFECTTAPYPYQRHPERNSNDHRWCGTLSNVDDHPQEWGLCKPSYQGTWHQWARSQCTAANVGFQKRTCLFPPCNGAGWRITMSTCKDMINQVPQWTAWNQWTPCGSCRIVKTRSRVCLTRAFKEISHDRKEKRNHCAGHSTETQPCDDTTTSQKKACKASYVTGDVDQSEVTQLLSVYTERVGNSANSIDGTKKFALLVIALLVVA